MAVRERGSSVRHGIKCCPTVDDIINPFDSKRFWLNAVESVPFGHYSISDREEPRTEEEQARRDRRDAREREAQANNGNANPAPATPAPVANAVTPVTINTRPNATANGTPAPAVDPATDNQAGKIRKRKHNAICCQRKHMIFCGIYIQTQTW